MTDARYEEYVSPFVLRWSSEAMVKNWSAQRKFSLWRRLWVALAEAEAELGLDITPEQIAQLRARQDDIPHARAEQIEAEVRHDVMAHIQAYGEQCPLAKPIIHLGATSCDVTDNVDLILMRDGLRILRPPLLKTIASLAAFAERHKALACLAFTHFQPAQVTTVGKRACLWIQDFLSDVDDMERLLEDMPFRGTKGATGTQASFLMLFEGDHEKCRELEQRVARKMGFDTTFPVTSQTYPRKLDFQVLSVLAGIAQSAAKMATDLRLLAGLKEMDEPFEKQQVGSSAMPYKRNPMRCERICSLARFVISLLSNPAITAAEQWLERTLDDSANRRLSLAEAFLATDAVLTVSANITSGLVVYPAVIRARLDAELPFMATEALLMEAVKAGGDRQALHKRIRDLSVEAGLRVKQEGKPNDLLERLRNDPLLQPVLGRFDEIVQPERFYGRAPQQVDEFLESCVRPLLAKYESELGGETQLRV